MRIKIDKADAEYSRFWREKIGICEVCKYSFPLKQLQLHHFYGRRHENTRFEPDNKVIVCFTHHRKFHENPEWARSFMIRKLGEE